MIVLDTHVLIWAVNKERKLGRKTKALVERAWASGGVGVSAMTFWEAGLLHERKRVILPSPAAEWREQLLAAGLTELPVDGWIATRALDLAALPADPVDRLIAATALRYQAALLTADEAILNWTHGLERHDARV